MPVQACMCASSASNMRAISSIRWNLPPSVVIHREEVDDVGPTPTVLVAVPHQYGSNRVTVGRVVDQHTAERSRKGASSVSRTVRRIGSRYPRILIPMR